MNKYPHNRFICTINTFNCKRQFLNISSGFEGGRIDDWTGRYTKRHRLGESKRGS